MNNNSSCLSAADQGRTGNHDDIRSDNIRQNNPAAKSTELLIYFIAGENSGDYIGSRIINSLKLLILQRRVKGITDKIIFTGVGGKLMQEQGMESLFPLEKINIMGFFEVIPHILAVRKLINQVIADILTKNPRMLITIDSPGFTFRVARQIKQAAPEIKLVHIVAPSVWAYRPGRAKQYASVYDQLLTLLPFEPEYFRPFGLTTKWIGHPVLEQSFYKNTGNLTGELKLAKDEKIIAVTPGSRKGEINRHMPIIKKALQLLALKNNIKAVFIQNDETNKEIITKFLQDAKFNYSFSTDRLKMFAIADCAIAKSGTNTLEIAASGTPFIVGYKLNPLSFWLLKNCIKVKFACLINIIADKEIIPEYIQSSFNPENIVAAITDLLTNPEAKKTQLRKTAKILALLGLNKIPGPSEKAARIIIREIM